MNIPTIEDISQIIEKVRALEKATSAFWEKETKRTKTASGEVVSALGELMYGPMDEQPVDLIKLVTIVWAAVKGQDIPLEYTKKDGEPLSIEDYIGGFKVIFLNRIRALSTSDLQRLLDVIPQFYRDEEIQVIDEQGMRTEEGKRLDKIREALRSELKPRLLKEQRRRKWERNRKTQESEVGERLTNLTGINILKNGWPKPIQLLIDEVDMLFSPWWDYLKVNGSWGANERAIIEAALKSTEPRKPKYSANVIHELEKIKYKMKIEAKQKQSPTEPVQKIKLQEKEGQVKTDMPDYREFTKVPVLKLIEYGEGHTLEFKETLEYDTQKKEKNKDIVLSSLKTIAGFLNAEGGTLLIGVDDSGKIKGIERDFSIMRHCNNDKFQQKIRNFLRERFEPQPIGKIDISFERLEEGTVCRVDVQASEDIIHLDNEVYVREGNTTQRLDGRALTDWTQKRKRT